MAKTVVVRKQGIPGPKGDPGDTGPQGVVSLADDNTWTGEQDFDNARVLRSTVASFPATPALARLGYATDQARGLWIGNGNAWHAVNGEAVNVQAFMTPSTSDSDAFEAASIAAENKLLLIPPGTYSLPLRAHPSSATTYAMLFVRTGTHVKGAGRGATVLRLPNATDKPGGATATQLIRNIGGGDTHLTFEDFTLDGNGANQGTTDRQHQGLRCTTANRVRFNRVHVKNLYGQGLAADTPSAGDIETMGFSLSNCSDVMYTDCEVTGDSGVSTSTGFGANACTGISYENCWAFGMSVSCGFANHKCREVSHQGCHAYKNGFAGFNSEYSEEAIYTGCFGGGRATSAADGLSHPFTDGENLGNARGFRMFEAKGYQISACSARYNSGWGAYLGNNSRGHINSGQWTNNDIGIEADASSRPETQIIGNAYVFANTTANIRNDLSTNHQTQGGPGYQPPVPASGATVANPYMLPAVVYIKGGTVTDVVINGNSTGMTSGSFNLPPRIAISITYSSAPTWRWFVGV